MKKLVFFLVFLSVASQANPAHQVVYEPDTKQLNITTELCLYGRGIQSALEETTFRNLSNFLRVQYKTIANDLAQKHNLKMRQKEYIELLLTLKMAPNSLHHTFTIIGNDTCTAASAQFDVADSDDFTRLFDFPAPNVIFLTSRSSDLEEAINVHLKSYQLPIKPVLYHNHIQTVTQYETKEGAESLYQFNLKGYTKSLTKSTNTVYVLGAAPYKQLLEQFLQNKSYAIQTSPESAHWQISVSGELEQQKFLALKLKVKNQANFKTLINNNSRKLPPSSLGNPILLEKFFNVHMELLKFTQVLEDNK